MNRSGKSLWKGCAASALMVFAVGGLSVGEPPEDRWRVLDFLSTRLPEHKPHYLMGVGTPEDIVEGVLSRHRYVRLRHANPKCQEWPSVYP